MLVQALKPIQELHLVINNLFGGNKYVEEPAIQESTKQKQAYCNENKHVSMLLKPRESYFLW